MSVTGIEMKKRQPKMTIPAEEIERLLRLDHHNPHSVLGAHPSKAGVVIRAFRPEAKVVTVIDDKNKRHVMIRRDPRGLFELLLEDRKETFSYQLEIQYENDTFTVRDPYTFLPTLGEMDLYLLGEGRHEELYQKLGAHVRTVDGVSGISFAVWAPSARSVSVVGDFNRWDGRLHQMRVLGSSGIWEIFIPEIEAGTFYKWEIHTQSGDRKLKTDPYAQAMELPPSTASQVFASKHEWNDHDWMTDRETANPWKRPQSIYEVHLGSWRRVPEEENRPLSYRELADQLVDYVTDLGFTHVELLPVQEHPYSKSWGYQVSGYFAPTARHGTPDDFRFFVDRMHQRGIGVIVDWVPAHFPKDDFALGRFDGTALYEHVDPKEGEHPDWGTYVFNYGRAETRNFLLASALYWLSEFHIDGLRVDAVASMIYRDYSRKAGEWVPNEFGGRENLEAISFLKELNSVAHRHHPGTLIVAEESTAYPGVSRPTHLGGLGFGFKWNMGWMHDTLAYFSKEPVHRKYHHNNLTFGLLYAWHENFVLPLSHDEVVHGKKALLDKMPGDRWQKFANLRSLYGFMWAYPGKKLLFMGGDIGQWSEWNSESSLDWHLLGGHEHRGLQHLLRDLNGAYRDQKALFETDFEASGFQWIDVNNADENVLAFMRTASNGEQIICLCNLSPVLRTDYRIGLPKGGWYPEIVNTDSEVYGGGNKGNNGGVNAESIPWHNLSHSASVTLPPLATVWFSVPKSDHS